MSNGIETFRLADELCVSRVVTGLWQIADLEKDGRLLEPEAAADNLEGYFEAGYTSFDMADHYGSRRIDRRGAAEAPSRGSVAARWPSPNGVRPRAR